MNSTETGCVAQSQQVSAQKAAAIAGYESELQTYNNEINADQNNIASLQTEASPSCSTIGTISLEGATGEQGQVANAEAATCDAYETEINSIEQQESQIEQYETSANNEILYIESLP
jgi:predicted  nucleic acid-binding Zn-ribbon protein